MPVNGERQFDEGPRPSFLFPFSLSKMGEYWMDEQKREKFSLHVPARAILRNADRAFPKALLLCGISSLFQETIRTLFLA